MRRVVLATAAVTMLVAQATAQAQSKLTNQVEMVVGDRPILLSKIEAEVNAQVEAEENRRRDRGAFERVTRSERQILKTRVMRELYRREALAQSSRSLGEQTREELDRRIERHLQDYERQEIEKVGSLSEFVRELEGLGYSWDTQRELEEQRARRDFSIYTEMTRRYRDRWALAVTPQEMFDWYRAHQDQFVREASSDVAVLSFPPAGDDLAGRLKNAAEDWRKPGADGQKIATEYDGILLDTFAGVRDVPGDNRTQEIKTFAAKAALGAVSDPVPRGRNVWLLKVVARTEGRHQRFEDPAVQEEILGEMIQEKRQEMEHRLIERSQRGLHVFPPWLAR
jgi:hypothetical protein